MQGAVVPDDRVNLFRNIFRIVDSDLAGGLQIMFLAQTPSEKGQGALMAKPGGGVTQLVPPLAAHRDESERRQVNGAFAGRFVMAGMAAF